MGSVGEGKICPSLWPGKASSRLPSPHLNLRGGKAFNTMDRGWTKSEGAVANGGKKWTPASSSSLQHVDILKVGSCLVRGG